MEVIKERIGNTTLLIQTVDEDIEILPLSLINRYNRGGNGPITSVKAVAKALILYLLIFGEK